MVRFMKVMIIGEDESGVGHKNDDVQDEFYLLLQASLARYNSSIFFWRLAV